MVAGSNPVTPTEYKSIDNLMIIDAFIVLYCFIVHSNIQIINHLYLQVRK